MVTINWVDDAWETAPNCDFSCNQDFHKDGNSCVANSSNQAQLDIDKVIKYMEKIDFKIDGKNPFLYPKNDSIYIYEISDYIKVEILYDSILKGIKVSNRSQENSEITTDIDNNNNIETIFLGNSSMFKIPGSIENGKVKMNFNLEFDTDEVATLGIHKKGENITLNFLQDNGRGGVDSMSIGGDGCKEGYESRLIEGKKVNGVRFSYDENDPNATLWLKVNNVTKIEFKPTQEFNDIFIPTDKDYEDYIIINGELTKDKKIENLKIVDIENSSTSSDSGCSYSVNSNSNILILLFFIGLIYFRKKRV